MMTHAPRLFRRRPSRRGPSRRQAIAGAAAAFGLVALNPPSFAAPRANPMPDDLRQALERSAHAPVLGNPDGNFTLTEFFDYNCGFCRKMMPTMTKLIEADPQLRVACRELPVFGEGSYFAARAALASQGQGRYWDFHRALMQIRGQADETSVMATAKRIGLDVERLRSDMEADWIVDHLATSLELADHMSLLGTPSFIAGDEAVFGEKSLQEMQALVKRGRETLG